MSTLDEMWMRLAEHQPFADQRGYGKQWKQMCEQRTEEAADAARAAADAAARAADAARAAADAADAAADAAWAAADAAEEAADWAADAIKNINKANKAEDNHE